MPSLTPGATVFFDHWSTIAEGDSTFQLHRLIFHRERPAEYFDRSGEPVVVPAE
jgi:hypothetical protein